MKDFLDQLHEDLSALHVSSDEVLHGLRQKLLRSWNHWPEVIRNYKISMQAMPKELRQRAFIKKAFQDIDSFELEIKSFFSEIREVSFLDVRKRIGEGLQIRLQQMNDYVAELEENPLVQKFLRGETIFSSKRSLQWGRKFTHAGLGMSFLYLFVYSGWDAGFVWTLTLSFWALCIFLEFGRHVYPDLNRYVCRFFGGIMRENEKTRVSSAMFYVFAMGVVLLVFPMKVVILTMLFIALGDPIAGIVGVYWGKTKLADHVSLEGFVACFAACSLLTVLCVTLIFHQTLPLASLLLFSLLCGLVGALAEASFKKLDDNLVMPLLSAPAIWGLMKVFL